MQTLAYNQVKEAISSSSHVLLMTDQRSDGDTFGSSLAFAMYLKALGKEVTHYASSPILEIHRFLPGMEHVTRDAAVLTSPTIDLVIVFDSSRRAFVEELTAQMTVEAPLVVFDHHASNDRFGEVNVVDPDASSTCAVVLSYFRHHNVSLSRDMAKCLMTGMMTDTGMFMNRGVEPSVFEDAARMLAQGGSIKDVVRNIHKQASITQLKLWGTVFSRLVMVDGGRKALTWIRQADLAEAGVDDEAIAELMDYMGRALNVDLVFFLKERDDHTVKVSMRANGMNALPIAEAYGGGGHPRACGFSLKGRIVEQAGRAWVVAE